MLTIHATGDLVLESGDPFALLQPSAAVLGTADLVIGHLEIPHFDGSGTVATTDVPATPGSVQALDAVAQAGFDVLTLAGNHVYDFGAEGIAATIANCEARGLQTTGAGADRASAERPARFDAADGTQVLVISVNCVGPRESWATTEKAGAAYVEVTTHYEVRGANPGGPPRVSTFADPQSLGRLVDAVRQAAAEAIVIVALHKGLVHQSVTIADYESEVAHAVIDAGATAVIGHHAHIMKGVELYRGRPIFHGLGNFATRTRALTASTAQNPQQLAWARERVRLFGFEPDPRTPEYPFHPESRNTAIAVIEIDGDTVAAGLIPCWIDEEARPVPVSDVTAERVCDYIRMITAEAGLSTKFSWNGEVLTAR